MSLCPLKDDVQPGVAADPGQRALDPNTLRNEGSAVGAGLDGDAKRLAGLGQPLATIAENLFADGACRPVLTGMLL